VDAEHAWSRAIDIGTKNGVSPVLLRSALRLMAMVESCLEDIEPLSDLLGRWQKYLARQTRNRPRRCRR
jgi:hypothetical protein